VPATIVAPAKELFRPVLIDATADEIPPAEQQRRFRSAIERLGLQTDTSSRV
jgi:hypothetical protein